MADSALTALPEVTASNDADLLYSVQNGNSRKTTRAKVIAPTVRHDIDQALLAAAKEKARQNISAAALDSDGIVPRSQLPASLFAGTGTVDSEAAMLALDVPVGFTAVRTDIDKNFVLNALPASALANWVELASPTAPVLSVAGKQGAVELEVADIIGLDEDLDNIQAAMLVKSAQSLTAAQQGQVQANLGVNFLSGFRNKFINPGLEYWQRGVSFTQLYTYTADRWVVYATAGGHSLTRESAIGAKWGGASSLAKLYYNGAGVQVPIFLQRVEDARTLAGKRVTVGISCTDLSSANLNMKVYVNRIYGAGGSATEQIIPSVVMGQISSTGVSNLSATFDIPDVEGKTFGSGHYIEIGFQVDENKPFTILMTGMFFVEGDATKQKEPVAYRNIEQEWGICNRYYRRIEFRHVWTCTMTDAYYTIPIEHLGMRTTPTESAEFGELQNARLDTLSKGRVYMRGNAVGTCVAGGVLVQNAEL